MEEDRIRWNSRYGEDDGYLLGTRPSPFLASRMAELLLLAPGRRALDVACGEGRNSVFLASHGFMVTGVDIADRGIAKAEALAAVAGHAVRFLRADLETWQPDELFDLIVNCNYLQRDLIPRLVDALTPRGVLLFDTLLDAPGAPPTRTRSHLLAPGELRQLFTGLPGRIVFCEERPDDTIPTSRLLFVGNS